MTWLPVDTGGANERDAVLGLHPKMYAAHRAFLEACDGAFDAELLTLCRARIAQSLRCREELARHSTELLASLAVWWEHPEAYTALQRDALTFCEQFILDPALISEDLARSLERELGTSGVLNFTTVVSAIEASLRLSTLLDLEPAR
jgi:alkylhydroperoxidase family enzyme